MSVILTSQFNRSEYVAAAGKAAALRQEEPSFMAHVTHDLTHAYAVVFAVAVGFVLATLIPAAFLPKKPPEFVSAQPTLAMAH
jgi:hypothetical protein